MIGQTVLAPAGFVPKAELTTPDFEAIKSKQNAAWTSGNYAVIGTTLQIVGEMLAESMDLVPGSQVLDVAAGNGNATLAFARRWHTVTSTDYVPTLLQNGTARSEAEGHQVKFMIADAEALPFEDNQFDGVVSTFGVMFTPNQDRAAQELIRVCKAGGKIGLANWTSAGFVGQLFKTLGAHVPPPAGVKSPALWGDKAWLETTFDQKCSNLEIATRHFVFRYRSPEHFIETFRALYGPVHKAFLALGEQEQAKLEADIISLIKRFSIATDGSMKVPGEYLEVVLTKA